MTELSRQKLKFVSHFASKPNSTRYVLQAVRVEKDRLAATDGNFLAVTEAKLPDIEPCNLVIESIIDALKVWPKAYKNRVVDETKKERLHFVDKAMPSIEKIEGKFPDIDNVIPKTEPVHRVFLGPKQLEVIAKAFREQDDKDPICLEFSKDGLSPVRFSRGEDLVVLMPCKGDKKTGLL